MTITRPVEQSVTSAPNFETSGMKILFVSTTYPTPRRPRQGAFNFNMVKSLRARHDVRVIAPVPWVECFGSKEQDKQVDSLVGDSDWHPTYFIHRRFFAAIMVGVTGIRSCRPFVS